MIYLYLTLLILPLSFVLFERRFNSQQAVYYSGVLGGGLWVGLTLLVSNDWTLIAEPIFLILISALSLKVKDENLFKYQPCITQFVVALILFFNGIFFNLGQRYTPIVKDLLKNLAEFEPYLYLNCTLSRTLLALRGVSVDLDECLAQMESLFVALETQIPWSKVVNHCINLSIYPLLIHSLILAYVVYKRPDSTIWLVARLMIYPLILVVNFGALGTFFFNQVG